MASSMASSRRWPTTKAWTAKRYWIRCANGSCQSFGLAAKNLPPHSNGALGSFHAVQRPFRMVGNASRPTTPRASLQFFETPLQGPATTHYKKALTMRPDRLFDRWGVGTEWKAIPFREPCKAFRSHQRVESFNETIG
jgi:hypothetical protein